jgi:hypothetical protein
MKTLWCAVLGMVILSAGCSSTGGLKGPAQDPAKGAAVTVSSVVGQPVLSVLKSAPGRRVEIFDKEGKRVPDLPKSQNGSVSVYNKEGTGQDNYAFNDKGVVTKHLRSVGPNYLKGVWEEVK